MVAQDHHDVAQVGQRRAVFPVRAFGALPQVAPALLGALAARVEHIIGAIIIFAFRCRRWFRRHRRFAAEPAFRALARRLLIKPAAVFAVALAVPGAWRVHAAVLVRHAASFWLWRYACSLRSHCRMSRAT